MSILDPNWKYTPSNATNIRKTFARIRREQAQQQARESENRSEAEQKVAPLKRKG